MNSARIIQVLEQGLIYPRAGCIVIESIAYERFPDIDVDRLADCLADALFDHTAAVAAYLSGLQPKEERVNEENS